MAVEPGGGCDSRLGHCLKEELKGLLESLGHVLQDHTGDPIRARRFVVRGAPQSLLHGGRGNASRDHRDCVLQVG